MNKEDFLASTMIGFLVGLAGFVAIYVRVRQWSALRARASSPVPGVSGPGQPTVEPTAAMPLSLRDAVNSLFALDRWADLAAVGFILLMLLYGAIVAPRLRYILFVAVITAAVAWRVVQYVMRWLRGGQVA